jgi:flagellar export protein FliJ
MKRFNWRLQRVLDIKQKEEQVKRSELVNLTGKLSQARGELFMQKRILEDLIDSVSQTAPADRLDRQAFFLTYAAANDATIKKLQKEICELTARQQEKIAEIMKLKQFNEGLEKLRTEARLEFFNEQEKLEQKEMDDAATSRFACHIMTHKTDEVVV